MHAVLLLERIRVPAAHAQRIFTMARDFFDTTSINNFCSQRNIPGLMAVTQIRELADGGIGVNEIADIAPERNPGAVVIVAKKDFRATATNGFPGGFAPANDV